MTSCFKCAFQLTIPAVIFYAGVVTAQRKDMPKVPTPEELYRQATGAEPPHSPSQAMEAASDLVESVTKGKGGPSAGR
jgi:hypothetical protein